MRNKLKNSSCPDIRQVYEASSTNTNVQYDRYLKPKEVIREIRAEKVENIKNHLTSQSLVIKSLWKEAFPDMIKDWHATLDKLPKNIYNFATRYLNNTLPTLKNMLLWNKATSNLCYSCSNVQSLQHIVSSCKVHLEQGRYTWRHNSVLKNLVEYLSSVKKDLSFYADVDGFENPSIIAGLEVRPDMIIVNTTIRAIYVIELTIGFETNITKNCTRKTLHYKEFCNVLKQRYDTVEYFNLSMGAIGVFGLECKTIYDFLDNVLGLDVSQRSFIVRKLCGVCIRSTYYLFCMRDRKWNNPELLYW